MTVKQVLFLLSAHLDQYISQYRSQFLVGECDLAHDSEFLVRVFSCRPTYTDSLLRFSNLHFYYCHQKWQEVCSNLTNKIIHFMRDRHLQTKSLNQYCPTKDAVKAKVIIIILFDHIGVPIFNVCKRFTLMTTQWSIKSNKKV